MPDSMDFNEDQSWVIHTGIRQYRGLMSMIQVDCIDLGKKKYRVFSGEEWTWVCESQ